MRSLPVRCVAGACVLLWLQTAFAAQRPVQLYDASVPVQSQEAGERARALSAALEEVLVRVSGRRDVRSDPALAAAIRAATSYSQLFRYRNEPVSTTVVNELGEEERVTEPQLHLWARFDARAVDELLTRAGFPVWGSERPVVVVWLATESPEGRVLVGGDRVPDAQERVLDTANARGIPALFPLLDLEDQQRVGVSEIWGGFMEDIRAASARYAADAILVGRAQQESGDWWSMRWLFWDGERERFWDERAPVLDELLAAGIHTVADALSQRYAVNTSTAGHEVLQITVRDVTTLQHYGRVLDYLRGLTAVESAEPVEVRENELVLETAVAGGREALDQAIRLGHTLRPVADAPSRIEDLMPGQQAIVYRLAP